MNHSEKVAKQIVEALLPGVEMIFRQNQSGGEHDFDILFPNGQTTPLEVTTSTDESYKKLDAAIRDTRKGGPFVSTNLCHQGWYVFPNPNANVNNIRRDVDFYLAAIEAEGRDEFYAYTDARESLAVNNIYMRLGIEAGRVFKWKQPGLIGISLPSQGSKLNPDHVLHAAETEAFKTDNRRKLAAVISSEHHLFIYIERRNFGAWFAINNASPPNQIPVLPKEITHLWIVASTYSSNKYVIWRTSVSDEGMNTSEVTLSNL